MVVLAKQAAATLAPRAPAPRGDAVPVPSSVVANPDIAANAADENMATDVSLKTSDKIASSSKEEQEQPAFVAPPITADAPRRSTRVRKRHASNSGTVKAAKRVKQRKVGARGESSKGDDEVDDEGDDEWGEGDEGESSSGDTDFENIVEEGQKGNYSDE